MSQIERDLDKMFENKLVNAIKDLVQAYEIVGLPRQKALAAVAAKCMQTAASIAQVCGGMERDTFIASCGRIYDYRMKANEREESDNG